MISMQRAFRSKKPSSDTAEHHGRPQGMAPAVETEYAVSDQQFSKLVHG